MYALIDDQSNSSLAKPEFFNMFKKSYIEVPYTLSSCAGVKDMMGRRSNSGVFAINSVDGQYSLKLPPLTECQQIPNAADEIPTPACAFNYPHLRDIASSILENKSAKILLLLGRDIPEVHHVLDQRIGVKAGYALAG